MRILRVNEMHQWLGYDHAIREIEKEFPKYDIHRRSEDSQFYDVSYQVPNPFLRYNHDAKIYKGDPHPGYSRIWIGCYDSISKRFALFLADSYDDYDNRKYRKDPNLEGDLQHGVLWCCQGFNIQEGFPKFVKIWNEFEKKEDLESFYNIYGLNKKATYSLVGTLSNLPTKYPNPKAIKTAFSQNIINGKSIKIKQMNSNK